MKSRSAKTQVIFLVCHSQYFIFHFFLFSFLFYFRSNTFVRLQSLLSFFFTIFLGDGGAVVLLFNTNNSIQHYSFIYTQSNDFKYCYEIPIIQFKTYSFAQLNGFKYFYLTLTIQFSMNLLFAYN